MCLALIKACWLVQYYRPRGMRGGCLKEARSHGALVFFFFLFFVFLLFFFFCFFVCFFCFFLFVFLALVGTLFSRAGRFE